MGEARAQIFRACCSLTRLRVTNNVVKRTCAISSSISFLVSVDTSGGL